MALALQIVALILGIVALAQSKLTNVLAWAVIALALSFLLGVF